MAASLTPQSETLDAIMEAPALPWFNPRPSDPHRPTPGLTPRQVPSGSAPWSELVGCGSVEGEVPGAEQQAEDG